MPGVVARPKAPGPHTRARGREPNSAPGWGRLGWGWVGGVAAGYVTGRRGARHARAGNGTAMEWMPPPPQRRSWRMGTLPPGLVEPAPRRPVNGRPRPGMGPGRYRPGPGVNRSRYVPWPVCARYGVGQDRSVLLAGWLAGGVDLHVPVGPPARIQILGWCECVWGGEVFRHPRQPSPAAAAGGGWGWPTTHPSQPQPPALPSDPIAPPFPRRGAGGVRGGRAAGGRGPLARLRPRGPHRRSPPRTLRSHPQRARIRTSPHDPHDTGRLPARGPARA
jgi:hypothetical protein